MSFLNQSKTLCGCPLPHHTYSPNRMLAFPPPPVFSNDRCSCGLGPDGIECFMTSRRMHEEGLWEIPVDELPGNFLVKGYRPPHFRRNLCLSTTVCSYKRVHVSVLPVKTNACALISP
ncbi:hypothetical protein SK128_011898 [Halocaridina rubra]|uniref:Uncharacterized protein n=1 Tax=Halocaridina rubra TaxID=373956 RepID=A0AAN8WUK9_HALRR